MEQLLEITLGALVLVTFLLGMGNAVRAAEREQLDATVVRDPDHDVSLSRGR